MGLDQLTNAMSGECGLGRTAGGILGGASAMVKGYDKMPTPGLAQTNDNFQSERYIVGIQEQFAMIRELLAILERRIDPVLVPECPEKCGDGSPSTAQNQLQAQLEQIGFSARSIAGRLGNIIGRITL